MVVALVWLLVLLGLLGVLLYALGVWSARPLVPAGAGRGRLGPAAVGPARWAAAHDEVDGRTRVLLRRSCPGPDGLPVVLEDRVYTAFAAADPAWEARFTEAMAGARFRCAYLNAEESAG
ncbi:hypothetical protein SAMN06893096_107149 [Geodermatophilus pulveris]|uniref:Uncharacterized protein n=1 Tax=Geodermatophilus pulveris TaxID=1564159 RepID=A0A239H0B9_9ACTN|nr:hypothetical protein [Geodermatophilus pulveris]SNS74916.1 hypothetical protein SAMN06893096_107149 [Geodermatophilus pulveris]